MHSGSTSSLPPLETQLWRKLWKAKTSPKLRHFLWCVLSGALAVKSRLRSRGIPIDTNCSLCNQGSETICHTLFHCPLAQEVWKLSGVPLPPAGWSTNSVFLNIHFLFASNHNNELGASVRFKFTWVLWQIWKARNKFCFEKVQPVPSEVTSLALDEASVWLNLHGLLPGCDNDPPVAPLSPQRWKRPPASFLKCNIGSSPGR